VLVDITSINSTIYWYIHITAAAFVKPKGSGQKSFLNPPMINCLLVLVFELVTCMFFSFFIPQQVDL